VPTIGLVVNPQAGRDSRRLVGSAVVSDTYAKRRSAIAVLEGATGVDAPIEFLVMPDNRGLAADVVDEAPEGVEASLLDIPITATRKDTRTAAAVLEDRADVVVAFGGDGTTRDVATAVDETPVAAISTGTNNVVPTNVDGTVAGLGAALLATGAVDAADATNRHRTVRGRVESDDETRTIQGIAALSIVDQPFTGTRAILHGADVMGCVVSRASSATTGVTGIAGAVAHVSPYTDGGLGLRLDDPETTPQSATAVTLPGVVERVGIAESRGLDPDESVTFEVTDGVVSADGERELEVAEGTVHLWPTTDGPRLVDFANLFDAATADGVLLQ
jgi:hypothetical protein